jgi:Zn2+/Cd2+-exporting ATPase
MADAVSIANNTRKIILQNIALALMVKGVFLVFGSFGLAIMWEAVFADMGTALLAMLNATGAFQEYPFPKEVYIENAAS